MRHPQADMLAEYAAGALEVAPSVAVTTHVQFCQQCRGVVDSLNELGGELLESESQGANTRSLLDVVLQRIDQPEQPEEISSVPATLDAVSQALPKYLKNLLPEGDLSWRSLSSTLRVANIRVGQQTHELALHHIDAGGLAPEHNHRGREITVVLAGCFSDEDGVYQPGDFLVREAGEIHRPHAAQNEACVCLSVLAAPIKLTGIKALLNPFLRFAPR